MFEVKTLLRNASLTTTAAITCGNNDSGNLSFTEESVEQLSRKTHTLTGKEHLQETCNDVFGY